MVQHSVEDISEIKETDFTTDATESEQQQQQQEPSTETRKGRKRERSPEPTTINGREEIMNIDDGEKQNNKKKQRLSISRSMSRCSRVVRPLHEVIPGEGLRDSAQKMKAIKLAKKAIKKRNKNARRGEADRVIPNLKPKHLYSGKRSNGKTHRR